MNEQQQQQLELNLKGYRVKDEYILNIRNYTTTY